MFTTSQMALAVRLTSVQGYSFPEAAEIMNRHGGALIKASDISEEISKNAPEIWEKISKAIQRRAYASLIGVSAPQPGERFKGEAKHLINFVDSAPKNLDENVLCWMARQYGFDCNITDIRITAQRASYDFKPRKILGKPYYKAIAEDGCLWPISNTHACNGNRQGDTRYCGPHYCRSLGSAHAPY